MSANMRPDAVTAFAIPFVMALSLCYLSVYTPMRAAWMEVSATHPSAPPWLPLGPSLEPLTPPPLWAKQVQMRDVDQWWHGNITAQVAKATQKRHLWFLFFISH